MGMKVPSVAAVYPDLAGRVALVTGGSKGIGAATSLALAGNGACVAVGGRDPESIAALVDRINADGGQAIGVAADCTRPEELAAMRGRVEAEMGPVDVLVAFAGGFGALTPLWEIPDDEWRAVIDSNLTATFLTLKAFLPGMIERRRGSVITMASNAARNLDITLTASYAAAKAGIVQLTRHAALEVGPHNVRINCVAPATTLTSRIERIMSPERRAEIARLSPLGSIGAPEDTASVTLFLASDVSRWITGITVDIAGGRVMM